MDPENTDKNVFGNLAEHTETQTELKHEPDTEQPLSRKPKTCTSDVWKSFTKIGIVDGKEKARCNGCNKEYVCGSKNIGTSTLLRHIPKCAGLSKFHDIGVMMLDQAGRLRSRKLDHKHVGDIISMMIIQHDLSYSFVEYKWARELLNYLNPDMKNISRNTAVSDVWKFYVDQKGKMKQRLANSISRVCLTSDCWTSINTEGFICVTAHFVDEDWKLNNRILAFWEMEPPHSGRELAGKIFNSLKEWGIDRKVFSLTLDNAAANDNMQKFLKEHLSLQNSLVSGGQFFHVRCCAHILNLILQEGLKMANGALFKIRESIRYVKSSEARMISFNECVAQVGGIDTSVGLKTDVSTRWNSTYVMLESAIKYRRAFGSLSLFDKNFKTCPSNDDWERAEKMREFLLPFYFITNLFSGSSYPTSNMYFMQIWKIECLLIDNMGSDELVVHDMAMKMKEKFDKYWSEYSVILAIASILDPRMKFHMLKFCYSKLDPINWEQKLEKIKRKLYELFAHYEIRDVGATSSSVPPSQATSTQHLPSTIGEKSKITSQLALGDYMDWSQNEAPIGKSELDKYLDEPRLEPQFYQDLDVLQHWKEHKSRYPSLSKMACDVLSILITTVASEATFSIGSRVLNKYRSSLHAENVQALICTRNC